MIKPYLIYIGDNNLYIYVVHNYFLSELSLNLFFSVSVLFQPLPAQTSITDNGDVDTPSLPDKLTPSKSFESEQL